MTSQKGSSAIDGIFAQRMPPTRPVAPRSSTVPAPFKVQVRIDGLWDERGTMPECLIPGCSYRLEAAMRPAGPAAEAGWHEVPMDGDQLELFVQAEGSGSLYAELQEEDGRETGRITFHVVRDALQGERKARFLIRVPPGTSPTGIELRITDDPRSSGRRACVFPLTSVAPAEPSPEPAPIPVYDPDKPPIPDTAWLYVSKETNRLKLSGFTSMRSTEDREKIGKLCRTDFNGLENPNLTLHTVTNPEGARNLLAWLRLVSEESLGELIAWINGLRSDIASLRLMIVDQSSAELPWEMLELDENIYLGAVLTVARWLPLSWGYGGGKRALEADCLSVTGRWVHFLPAYGPDWKRDRDELEAAESEGMPDSAALYDRLQKLTDVGLVYVGCHGLVATVESKARFQLQDDMNVAVIYDVDVALLPQLKEDGRVDRLPVVVVNACHSGRLTRSGDLMFGMPSLFLRRVARGYIGTLGAVEVREASIIGAKLLARVRAAGKGVVLADVLRELRWEAAQGFDPKNPDDPNWIRFATAFMYVYYGDPRLELHPNAGTHNG